MTTLLRRLFWLAVLGGGGFAAWSVWQRQRAAAPAAPQWPPIASRTDTTDSPVAASGLAALPVDEVKPAAADAGGPVAAGERAARTWVAPVDGRCPDGYPVKANDNSGIFHVPGGRFYDRTVPERCYADAADAEADGYRRAKA